ncbi:hypothetical protein GW17_00032633 [Ensete ventricosum]|nr:hypothetical protein GW17_00032633 [Ensete ventricosum]
MVTRRGRQAQVLHRAARHRRQTGSPSPKDRCVISIFHVFAVSMCRSGLERCGKTCRLRWLNYLRPNIKHGRVSPKKKTPSYATAAGDLRAVRHAFDYQMLLISCDAQQVA